MNNFRHWFWHIAAMLSVCDMYQSEVTDEELIEYKAFMKRHGFDGCP